MRARQLLLAILLLATMACPPLAVHGQGDWPCDQTVVDRAAVLGPQVEQVRAAADELIRLGADVRVFTVDTTGLGNLDLFVDDVVNRCPSWRAAGGGMKDNLVVVGISLEERKSGLYYGQRWSAVLDGHYTRIQVDLMNPHFAEEDFAGGFVVGLAEIGRLVDRYLHPAAATPAPTSPPATAVPTTTQVQVTAPAGGSAALIVLAVVGGALVCVAATVGIVLFARQRAERRKARQRAREAKLRVADQLLRLRENLPYVEAEIENAAQMVSAEETARWRGQLAEIRGAISQTTTDYDSLQVAGNDPDREGLSREEYEGFAASLEQLLDTLGKAHTAVEGMNQRFEELRRLLAQVPQTLDQTESLIQQDQSRVAELTVEYQNMRSQSLLEEARGKLDQARAAGERQQPEEVGALVEEAKRLSGEAVTVAGLLPALAKRIQEVEVAIDAGAETFDQIAHAYAESSWQEIRGNGTEAENRVDWAEQALRDASDDLASSEATTWTEALEEIEQAGTWLDEAIGLIESIAERKQHLEQAAQDAPQEAQAAREDIEKARSYITQHDPDIREALEKDLDEAAGKLQQAAAELEQHEKPDYLHTLTLAQQANQAADQILETARSEHEAIERLRRQLKSALRDAESTVSRAGNYISNHHHDVSPQAKGILAEAETALREAREKETQARQSEDLARRQALEESIPLAQQARSLADSAYSQAEADFRRAEAARFPPVTPRVGPVIISSGWGSPRPAPRPRRSIPERRGGSSSWSRPADPGPRRQGGGSTSWGGPSRRPKRGGGSTGW